MIVSTKGRYALRVMADMAAAGSLYTPMKDVAARQGVSKKYMEQIMPLLVKGGLVEGVRGLGGGYRLTKKPEEYTLFEILSLVEGDLAPVSCLECGAEPCPKRGECRTLPMWTKLHDMIGDYLDSVTLADLLAGKA